MYLTMLFGLITEGAASRAAAREARRHRPATTSAAGLATLNDHHLRDVGYVRERVAGPRNHILWM